MDEKVVRSSDMDSLLAYRNYLAAEDHLDELIYHASDSGKKQMLESMMERTVSLRDGIMPAESDPDAHCLVKHYAVAYEAVRERWKADMTDEKYWQKKSAFDLLIDALEMLWNRKVTVCERCNLKKEEDGRDTRDSVSSSLDGGGAGHGQPREVIQTAVEDRSSGSESLPTPSEIRDRIIEATVERSAKAFRDSPDIDWDAIRENY